MIIPIFIPHEGCPNDCKFCNQRTISGSAKAPLLEETKKIIDSHLETMNGYAEQIAFFGGSFTGIEEEKQNEYLKIAQEYIEKGKVGSIRLSTRPDYISEKTVKRLISYGVKNIELGAQSMDDKVLIGANRGHTAFDVEKASKIIVDSGAVLGLQMMTGLPYDNDEKCLMTARRFFELGAAETRIYPTIVLKGTSLAEAFENGEYEPHTLENAVELCAKLYEYFNSKGIFVLRCGLPDGEQLRKERIAGPYHPSFGELVQSRVLLHEIEGKIGAAKKITVMANPKLISKIVGNKKSNIAYFRKKGINIDVIKDINIEKMTILAE